MCQIQIGGDGVGRTAGRIICIVRLFTHVLLISRPSIQSIFGVIHGLQRPAMLTRRGTRLRSETHLGGKRKARSVQNGWSAYLLSPDDGKDTFEHVAGRRAVAGATVHRFIFKPFCRLLLPSHANGQSEQRYGYGRCMPSWGTHAYSFICAVSFFQHMA